MAGEGSWNVLLHGRRAVQELYERRHSERVRMPVSMGLIPPISGDVAERVRRPKMLSCESVAIWSARA